ncbi:hypothetical protein [Halorussus ruber]|uniref:hypothetical protein n=1 Tax=Halorussus ruber TaxID=1126238 RepID=UPI001092A09D|nr:hypothetical protein [Halorussus ruber]
MKSKLLALTLAVAAILAVGTGGIVATDDVSSDSPNVEQPEEPTEANDSAEYDERLTADESFQMDLNENQFQQSGDGVVVDLAGDEQTAETTTDESAEYDERLTADESFRIELGKLTPFGDELIRTDIRDE